MIKTILFDLDGVLVDAVNIHKEAFLKAIRITAFVEIPADYHDKNLNGLPTKVKVKKLIEDGLIAKPKDEEKFAATVNSYKQSMTFSLINKHISFDREKYTALKLLKENRFKIGCVTNSIKASAELMLQKIGVLDMLDVLITNEDVAYPKPDPSGYEKAMKKLNSSPNDTLIVEDSKFGIQAANAANATVLIVRGPSDVTYENIIKAVEV